jgi:hypothetical protein
MSIYRSNTRLSILIDPVAPAGQLAREIREALGQRRSLILATKLRGLADLAPSYRTVRGRTRRNGYARPKIVELLADAAD